MNQDNKEFELSGTLGSLNDTAINNLANDNTNVETANNLEQNKEVIGTINNDIEMLDVATPVVEEPVQNTSVEPVINQEVVNQPVEANTKTESELNIDPLNMPTQPDLNPIPTNFDIGDIGSVPPVDPTGKGEKKSKKKNVLFIILVIIFILAIGGLIFYYLHVSKGSIGNAVETKELQFELGKSLPTDINEYATFKSISGSNCILNVNNVDTSKAGTYEYTITCGNNTYKGNIVIKDSSAPEAKSKTIVKKVNDTITPEEFISECNDSTECTYEFADSELVANNMKQAGTYEFDIIVKDANENSNTIPVKLIVIDSDIKVYLNCGLSNQTIEGFNGSVSYIDKIGISTEHQYVGLYFKITEFIVTTEEEYNNIKNNYTENGILDINNGEGTPIFDDTNLTITFEETLSGEADFGTDYSSIKTYYETTKGYKCNIINVN